MTSPTLYSYYRAKQDLNPGLLIERAESTVLYQPPANLILKYVICSLYLVEQLVLTCHG